MASAAQRSQKSMRQMSQRLSIVPGLGAQVLLGGGV